MLACRATLLVLLGLWLSCLPASATTPTPRFDLLILGGTVFDGTGSTGQIADVGVRGDRVVAIGALAGAPATTSIDATGMAVAPGFINMLSWATESLLVDGRAQSDIRQGVTLEVFGEGTSMGPLSDRLRADLIARQGDLKYPVEWTGFGEYLEYLETKGVAPNVASFVGATTVRINVLGYDNRQATPEELARMQAMVRSAARAPRKPRWTW